MSWRMTCVSIVLGKGEKQALTHRFYIIGKMKKLNVGWRSLISKRGQSDFSFTHLANTYWTPTKYQTLS